MHKHKNTSFDNLILLLALVSCPSSLAHKLHLAYAYAYAYACSYAYAWVASEDRA